MVTYSGNKHGERSYFVFDRTTGTGGTSSNFIGVVDIDGTTSDYVAAGGGTHGSIANLLQFIGNVSYLNYKRTNSKKLSSLDKSGGITTTILKYTPDPRILVGIFASGDSGSFTGNHMDEIHVTDSGNTYQAFLGKLSYPEDNSGISTGHILIDLLAYGLSGSDVASAPFNFVTGYTIANKTNGVTTEFKNAQFIEYIKTTPYKTNIMSQVGMSFDTETMGLTGVTIGVGANAKMVFFSPINKELVDYVGSVLPAFAFGGSGASGTSSRQTNVFTMLAGTTTGTITEVLFSSQQLYGVTFNAVTGGTLGNSEFEEFAHHVVHTYVGKQNRKGSIIYTITKKLNIRDIDQVSF